MMNPRRHPLPALAALLWTGLAAAPAAMATEHVVKMLNSGKDGAMVFEPAFAIGQDIFDKTLALVK
jgi:hypothetical protein